ncbi:MAG: phosphotransferase [Candidatus Glassbacteria bacterium]|nr:phosphotransferase [Candidatus Glassbacteria bacterium]
MKAAEERERWLGFIERCFPGRYAGGALPELELLAGGGSARRFYRVGGAGPGSVLMVNPAPPADPSGRVDENDSYVYLAGLLRKVGAGAPEVYGYERVPGLVLMEDLGDRHLRDQVLARGAGSAWTGRTYRRLLDLLLVVQLDGGAVFEPERVFNPAYDAGFMFAAEGLYFAEYFVEKHCGARADRLRDELRALAGRAGESFGQRVLLYRDFQSSNIILGPADELRLLDFQGARPGPPAYDAASLLYDPYVALPEGLRSELLDYYRRKLAGRSAGVAREFGLQFPLIAAHRLMQVLGAYAKLSLVDRKDSFLQYVPSALAGLREVLSAGVFDDYPLLRAEAARLGS